MSYFEFPHTRTYDNDLGWVIRRLVAMDEEVRNFINFNKIKYADPIAWNITTQYEANTVVIDPATGTAYISTRPVPSGISVTNTGYWTPIFNYGADINKLREQIAAGNEEASPTATRNYAAGDLVWLNGYIYRTLYAFPAGTAFVVGTNVEKTTVEDEIKRVRDGLDNLALLLGGRIDDLDSDLRDLEDVVTNLPDNLPKYTVNDYGIFADGTDVSDKVQALLDAGIQCVFPSGVYHFSKKLTVNGSGSLRGSGLQNTILLWDSGATAGIEATLTLVSGEGTCLQVSDLTLGKSTAAGGTAIKVIGTAILDNERAQMAPIIRNVNIDVYDADFWLNGWGRGIELLDCNGVEIAGCSITGSNAQDLSSFNSDYGIYIHTELLNAIGTEFMITDCKITAWDEGIFMEKGEGLVLTACFIIACNLGVHWEDQNFGHPQMNLTNCHFACLKGCIYTYNVQQLGITNCLIYLNANENSKAAIACFGPQTEDVVICDNVIVHPITGFDDGHIAIALEGSYGLVQNNIITFGGGSGIPHNGIWLRPGATNYKIWGNIFHAIQTAILNTSGSPTNIYDPGNLSLVDVSADATIVGFPSIGVSEIGAAVSVLFATTGTIHTNDIIFKINTPIAFAGAGNIPVVVEGTANTVIVTVDADGNVISGNDLGSGALFRLNVFLRYATV